MLNIFYLIPLILIGVDPTHMVLTTDNNVHMVQLITMTDTELILLETDGDTLKIPLSKVKKISQISNNNLPSPVKDNTVYENIIKVKPKPYLQREHHSTFSTASIIEISVGMGIPDHPAEFSDYWKKGIIFGIQIGGGTVDNRFGVEINYSKHEFDREKFRNDAGASGILITGGDVTMITVLGGNHFGSETNFGPSLYLSLFAGMFFMNISDLTISNYSESETLTTESENGFAFKPALGIDIGSNKGSNVSLEVSYLFANTKEEFTNILSFKAGMTF